MYAVIAFMFVGYLQAALLQASILNLSKTHWTIKRLLVTVSVAYIILIIIARHEITVVTVIAWIFLTILAFHFSYKQSWQRSVLMGVGQNYIACGLELILLFVAYQLPEGAQAVVFDISYGFLIRSIMLLFCILIYAFTKRFTNREFSPFDILISKYRMICLVVFSLFAAYNIVRLFSMRPVVDNQQEIIVIVSFLVLFVCSLIHMNTLNKLESAERRLKVERFCVDVMGKELEAHDLHAKSLRGKSDK